MAQEPFPGHGQDGAPHDDDDAQPERGQGSGAEAGTGDDRWPEDDWDAEAAIDSLVAAADVGECELPPGWPEDGEPPTTVFSHDGLADAMGPGPVLAVLVHGATRDKETLAGLTEDELVGVISAVRRLESRAAWTSMTAMRELAARRPAGQNQAGAAADELALELCQSWQSVAGQIEYACLVATRLPRTFAALAAGRIHPVHVRIIEDETRYLKPADAARADEELAEAAASKSFGELRYAAHRLVLKLDPDLARRRKEEQAKREAHVRRFREDSGNAGMVARELPPDEVLASWQHVEQRALDLRSAGISGSLRELRIRAYLDLLQERDSRASADRVGGADPNDGGPQPGDGGSGGGGSPGPGPSDSGGTGTATQPAPDAWPSVAALVTITVPLTILPGQPATPGQPAPAGSAGPDWPAPTGPAGPDWPAPATPGWPAPAGPAGPDWPAPATPGWPAPAGPAGPDWPAPATPGWPAPAGSAGPDWPALAGPGWPGPAGPDWPAAAGPGEVGGFGLLDASDTADLVAAAARHPRTRWCLTLLYPDGTAAAHGCAPGSHPGPPSLSRFTLTTVIRGPCDHAQAELGYVPSRRLRHLVAARSTRCTAPGCSRPAARCDLDHTTPWDQGGLTCPCNLSPLCRRHHRCKQAKGWRLDHPEPGVLVWRTPTGRTYTTTPTSYPL
jgi:Domain of unknown function (DUF222)